MSLAVMNRPETLKTSAIEPVFHGVEEVMDGPQIRRTIIGELEGNRLARIKRVSMTVLRNEVDYHDYEVDLAAPYDYDRFQLDVTVVCSSLWVVTPQAAKEEEVVAEVKDPGQFAVFDKKALEPLACPEDIFDLYDKEDKGIPGVTPDISPNIYTPEGMLELLQKAKFRSLQTNG